MTIIHGVIVSTAVSAALGALCCRVTETWVPVPNGGAPCTAAADGQRQYCETGGIFTGNGLRREGDFRLAKCYALHSREPSDYIHAQCGTIIPDYMQIGPPLPGGQGQCCFIRVTPGGVEVTSTDQQFSIFSCDGSPCP